MRVQTFGDSICTFRWARALAAEPDVLAEWGATTEQLAKQVQRADADVAVVSVGVNDALANRPVQPWLGEALDVLTARCGRVILLPAQVDGTRQRLVDLVKRRRRYPQVRARLAEQAALRLPVIVADVRLGVLDWQADGVHPNRRGEAKIDRAVRVLITR